LYVFIENRDFPVRVGGELYTESSKKPVDNLFTAKPVPSRVRDQAGDTKNAKV
jgi:hypothetical protein